MVPDSLGVLLISLYMRLNRSVSLSSYSIPSTSCTVTKQDIWVAKKHNQIKSFISLYGCMRIKYLVATV